MTIPTLSTEVQREFTVCCADNYVWDEVYDTNAEAERDAKRADSGEEGWSCDCGIVGHKVLERTISPWQPVSTDG